MDPILKVTLWSVNVVATEAEVVMLYLNLLKSTQPGMSTSVSVGVVAVAP